MVDLEQLVARAEKGAIIVEQVGGVSSGGVDNGMAATLGEEGEITGLQLNLFSIGKSDPG